MTREELIKHRNTFINQIQNMVGELNQQILESNLNERKEALEYYLRTGKSKPIPYMETSMINFLHIDYVDDNYEV